MKDSEKLRQASPTSATAELGQRVTRKKTNERGTVVDIVYGKIEVVWDKRATSYFRRGDDGNIPE